MKKNILIGLSTIALIISCNNSSSEPTVNKPLTTNVPSADKTKKEGTPLSEFNTAGGTIEGRAVAQQQQASQTYPLNERLYSSTWYQSEEDYDDGVLETEEVFVFFDQDSKKSKREYENGRLDETDYANLQHIENISTGTGNNNDMNAVIVKVKEQGDDDYEYEGYYMTDDRKTLYIVEEDNQSSAKSKLTELINDVKGGRANNHKDKKYLLSIQAR